MEFDHGDDSTAYEEVEDTAESTPTVAVQDEEDAADDSPASSRRSNVSATVQSAGTSWSTFRVPVASSHTHRQDRDQVDEEDNARETGSAEVQQVDEREDAETYIESEIKSTPRTSSALARKQSNVSSSQDGRSFAIRKRRHGRDSNQLDDAPANAHPSHAEPGREREDAPTSRNASATPLHSGGGQGHDIYSDAHQGNRKRRRNISRSDRVESGTPNNSSNSHDNEQEQEHKQQHNGDASRGQHGDHDVDERHDRDIRTGAQHRRPSQQGSQQPAQHSPPHNAPQDMEQDPYFELPAIWVYPTNASLRTLHRASGRLGMHTAQDAANAAESGHHAFELIPVVQRLYNLDNAEIHQQSTRRLRDIQPFQPMMENEPIEMLHERFNALKAILFEEDPSSTPLVDVRTFFKARVVLGAGNMESRPDPETLFRNWKERTEVLEMLRTQMTNNHLASDDESALPAARQRYTELVRMIHILAGMYQACSALAETRGLRDLRHQYTLGTVPAFMALLGEGTDAAPPKKPMNYICNFVLQWCAKWGIRKDKDGTSYYKCGRTRAGIRNFTFERRGDISEILWRAIEPTAQHPVIHQMVQAQTGVTGRVAEYLKNYRGPELPVVERHQRVWAFDNGIFIGHLNTFYKYSDPALTDDIVACRYFPVIFDHEKYTEQIRIRRHLNLQDWRKLRTEHVQQILKDQKLQNAVTDWWYIFSGKMAYKIGEIDKWQVQLFVKGTAGSGKSTLLQHLIYCWDPIDIGYLSNTVERNFPLEGLLTCFACFAMDLSNHFGLDQTLWQSMVSGEGIAINRKHRVRISIVWTIPSMWAGNVNPPYHDNAGSVSRRLPMLLFLVPIDEYQSKPHLQDDMRQDIGAFIKKMMSAYADFGFQRGDESFWTICPAYFREKREELRKETNLLEAFLGSSYVSVAPGYMTTVDEFLQMFKSFCVFVKGKSNAPEWVDTYYMGIFKRHGIRTQGIKPSELHGRTGRSHSHRATSNGLIDCLLGVTIVSSDRQRSKMDTLNNQRSVEQSNNAAQQVAQNTVQELNSLNAAKQRNQDLNTNPSVSSHLPSSSKPSGVLPQSGQSQMHTVNSVHVSQRSNYYSDLRTSNKQQVSPQHPHGQGNGKQATPIIDGHLTSSNDPRRMVEAT